MTSCLSCNTFGARFRYDQQFRVFFLLQGIIKALKTLMWHFFKGAYERNDYFEKNKQTKIQVYDEQIRTNKAKDYQSQGQTDLGMNSVVYNCANRTV